MKMPEELIIRVIIVVVNAAAIKLYLYGYTSALPIYTAYKDVYIYIYIRLLFKNNNKKTILYIFIIKEIQIYNLHTVDFFFFF